VCKRDERELGYSIPPRGTWLERRRKARRGSSRTPRSTRSSSVAAVLSPVSPVAASLCSQCHRSLTSTPDPCSSPMGLEQLWSDSDPPVSPSVATSNAQPHRTVVTREDVQEQSGTAGRQHPSREDVRRQHVLATPQHPSSRRSASPEQYDSSPSRSPAAPTSSSRMGLGARLRAKGGTPNGSPRGSERPSAVSSPRSQMTNSSRSDRLPHSHPSLRGTPRTVIEEEEEDLSRRRDEDAYSDMEEAPPVDGNCTSRSYGSLADSAVMLKESWHEDSHFSPEARDRNASSESIHYF